MNARCLNCQGGRELGLIGETIRLHGSTTSEMIRDAIAIRPQPVVGENGTALRAADLIGFLSRFRENAIDESHMTTVERCGIRHEWIQRWSMHENLQHGLRVGLCRKCEAHRNRTIRMIHAETVCGSRLGRFPQGKVRFTNSYSTCRSHRERVITRAARGRPDHTEKDGDLDLERARTQAMVMREPTKAEAMSFCASHSSPCVPKYILPSSGFTIIATNASMTSNNPL